MEHLPRILLVEDNRICQIVAKTHFEKLGIIIDIASSGKEAIELANRIAFDLIFMDIGLEEGTNGFEVTKYIRINSKINQITPIIALTAHTDKKYKELAIKSGMQAFHTKPLEQEDVQCFLNNFLHIKEIIAI